MRKMDRLIDSFMQLLWMFIFSMLHTSRRTTLVSLYLGAHMDVSHLLVLVVDQSTILHGRRGLWVVLRPQMRRRHGTCHKSKDSKVRKD